MSKCFRFYSSGHSSPALNPLCAGTGSPNAGHRMDKLKMKNRFFNLYSHDFARVAVGVPRCRVADPAFNAAETIDLAKQAAANGAVLVAFPELGLPAYTCDDLFHQRALLDACEEALASVVAASKSLSIAMIVGMPLRVDHTLFNCAVVVAGGQVQGVVPKS